jgi:hypothetical protein
MIKAAVPVNSNAAPTQIRFGSRAADRCALITTARHSEAAGRGQAEEGQRETNAHTRSKQWYSLRRRVGRSTGQVLLLVELARIMHQKQAQIA